MNGSHASYSVIVIEKCNIKIVYAIYPMVYTSRYYGIMQIMNIICLEIALFIRTT